MTSSSPIRQVLDYGRWAPSGDNVQNWQFQFINETEAIIHGRDESSWLVYDKMGNASKLALGCLLETITIAAQTLGFKLTVSKIANRHGIEPEQNDYDKYPTFQVTLETATHLPDPLFDEIKRRSVQRKLMGTTALTTIEKQQLESSLPSGFSVVWLDSAKQRHQIAKLMYGNATTRYLMKEGYDTHSKIIEFASVSASNPENEFENNRFSKSKLPAKSLGMDPVTVALMEWVLASWERFQFVSTYLAGTVWPKVMMDYMTAIRCSSHFLIVADNEAQNLDDFVTAGRALQRFWLQSSELHLGFQPEQTPIIFSEYLRTNVDFTTNDKAVANAKLMDQKIKLMLGEDTVKRAIFMGRLGRSTQPEFRSVRKSLEELEYKP